MIEDRVWTSKKNEDSVGRRRGREDSMIGAVNGYGLGHRLLGTWAANVLVLHTSLRRVYYKHMTRPFIK
jgi:hypothetical protein